MIHRTLRFVALAALVVLVSGVGPAEARYRYGRYRAVGAEKGFFVFVEGMVANPRNADAVIATSELVQDFGGGVNALTPVLPTWDDKFAGRIGFGYRWGDGNKLVASFWGFETDQAAAVNGPAGGHLHFAIGPPILTGGEYVGNYGSPGYAEVATDITARTADVALARDHEIGDSLTFEWSVGVRYAYYEETMAGTYDDAASTDPGFGLVRYEAAKSNEGEMFGARIAARGTRRLTERLSVSSGLGLSFLDGELLASSSLSPVGLDNVATEPRSFAAAQDDGRSGNILDFDVVVGWQSPGDGLRVWAGWEQSIWNDITTDLMRNFPGTSAPLQDRDSVTFSGYKVGVLFRF